MRSPARDAMPSVARAIAEADDRELLQTFTRLRKSKQLFNTVHGLNLMLAEPEHREVAQRALRRLGLDRAG